MVGSFLPHCFGYLQIYPWQLPEHRRRSPKHRNCQRWWHASNWTLTRWEMARFSPCFYGLGDLNNNIGCMFFLVFGCFGMFLADIMGWQSTKTMRVYSRFVNPKSNKTCKSWPTMGVNKIPCGGGWWYIGFRIEHMDLTWFDDPKSLLYQAKWGFS